MKTIYLAGGCFWGMQRFLDQFPGVLRTQVGYANGPGHASYEEVCRSSGHAETVRVDFDEAILEPGALLDFYFMAIDPLSVNRQGNDRGVQYRTGIYYDDRSLLPAVRAAFDREQAKYSSPLAVELKPLEGFWPAEEYHQKYLEKNPGGYCHIGEEKFHLTEK